MHALCKLLHFFEKLIKKSYAVAYGELPVPVHGSHIFIATVDHCVLKLKYTVLLRIDNGTTKEPCDSAESISTEL